MSEKKIDKAIAESLSSINVEDMDLTREELALIKKALQDKSKPKVLLSKLLELIKTNKEDVLYGKDKQKNRD